MSIVHVPHAMQGGTIKGKGILCLDIWGRTESARSDMNKNGVKVHVIHLFVYCSSSPHVDPG